MSVQVNGTEATGLDLQRDGEMVEVAGGGAFESVVCNFYANKVGEICYIAPDGQLKKESISGSGSLDVAKNSIGSVSFYGFPSIGGSVKVIETMNDNNQSLRVFWVEGPFSIVYT